MACFGSKLQQERNTRERKQAKRREQCLPIPTKPTSPYNLISDIDISAHGVHKQLLQLNPRKACRPDEIPARVLTELAPSIAPWLSSIFQHSCDTGAEPSDWTKALVTAIHKKDSKSNPVNYRPISLTSRLLL